MANKYGTNHGYNEAEAENFANSTWLALSQERNAVETAEKIHNSVLVPVEFPPFAEVDCLILQTKYRSSGNNTNWHCEDARDVYNSLER